MYCPKCRKENPDQSQFCSGCGAPLSENSYGTKQTAPAQQYEPPKKKKKKWWIIVIILLAVLILFWAIGSGGDDSSDNGKEGNTVAAEKNDNPNNVGSYNIEVKNSKVVTDDGDKILIVTYTYTNNSDENNCFDYSVTDTAFQDGVELGDVWSSYGIKGLSFDNKSKEIKPGKSLDVQCAYELNDDTTDVEIQFTLFSVWTDTVYETFTIKI